MSNKIAISTQKLQDWDVWEWLKYVWNADKLGFVQAFENIGLKINSEKDLQTLKQIHEDKKDISGHLKDANGRPIFFNVLEVLHKVEITKEEITDALENRIQLIK